MSRNINRNCFYLLFLPFNFAEEINNEIRGKMIISQQSIPWMSAGNFHPTLIENGITKRTTIPINYSNVLKEFYLILRKGLFQNFSKTSFKSNNPFCTNLALNINKFIIWILD